MSQEEQELLGASARPNPSLASTPEPGGDDDVILKVIPCDCFWICIVHLHMAVFDSFRMLGFVGCMVEAGICLASAAIVRG